eukprot:ANDGO_08219.mRNA.1 Thiopurine S-methyltransferase
MSSNPFAAESSESYWSSRWAKGETGWKRFEVNKPFASNLAFLSECIGEPRMPKLSDASVLVPLCGDSAVLRFFYDCGCRQVTGIEFVSSAVEKLMAESFPELQFTKSELGYTSSDKRVCILQGDFFERVMQTPLETYDIIYDRASMVAIAPDARPRYAELIHRKTSASSVMFLEVVLRSPEKACLGPPFMVPLDQVSQQFYPPYKYSFQAEAMSEADRQRIDSEPFVFVRTALSRL